MERCAVNYLFLLSAAILFLQVLQITFSGGRFYVSHGIDLSALAITSKWRCVFIISKTSRTVFKLTHNYICKLYE